MENLSEGGRRFWRGDPKSVLGWEAGRLRPDDVESFEGESPPVAIAGELVKVSVTKCQANLMGKARGVLRHLRKFYRLKSLGKIPPHNLTCLTFRQVIRDQLPAELTLVQELTVKTASKIVKKACSHCREKMSSIVEEYKQRLFQPVDVDDIHLQAFRRAFALNVPEGWNKNGGAYIPNGHGTIEAERKSGGNWNEEGFSPYCRVEAVLSSGKPRVVTMYSSFNTSVLSPLHDSLFAAIKRKGWLLVGSPTNEKIQMLNGKGPILSYDYERATDRFKAAYVREAISVLKEKAEPALTVEQNACLDVLGEIRFLGDERKCHSGQPMGSKMSFPLLCLFNKTVVDLSMVDLLENKDVTFKEWTSHRCLINGDDLIMRSPTLNHGVYDASHRLNGAAVGMVVNAEKTLVREQDGEINSTLFHKGELVKKTNLAALYMSGETDDVIGMAFRSTVSIREFKRVVDQNAWLLARQFVKFPTYVPANYRLFLLSSERIRRALKARPSSPLPAAEGVLPMAERPLGYDLSQEDERQAISEAVSTARVRGYWRSHLERVNSARKAPRPRPVEDALPLREAFRPKKIKPQRDLILRCCARWWENKRKQQLWDQDCEALCPPDLIVSDDSRIGGMLDSIRAWKSARLPTTHRVLDLDVEADGHITEGFLKFV